MKIKVPLTETGIDNAIKELNDFKKWLAKCTKAFVKELGNEGMEIASVKFGKAEYDGTNDVTTFIEERGENKVAVLAVGGAVLFIEFGSGVKYTEPHPEAAKNGMVRGAYGYGLGKNKEGWRYKGESGTHGEVIQEGRHKGEVHTYGNPANMSMYLTVRELEEKFAEIAKKVYVR